MRSGTGEDSGMVRRIYLFSFFRMFLVLIPVAVPYFLQLGVSMHEVFQLQAVFALTVVIFEVPTGYFGDLFGRKKSIVTGTLLSGLGYSILFFAREFWSLAAFEVMVAIGDCFISGADVSLLYDHHADRERRHGTQALGNLQLASQLGESAASVLGGLVAMIGLQAAAWTNAVTAWIPLLIALGFVEPHYERMRRESHLRNLKDVIAHIHGNADRIVPWTFLNGVVWGLSTFFVVWMLQKYWRDQGVPLAWFGVLWAALNLSTGLVGKRATALEMWMGSRALFTAVMVLPILGYLGMGTLGGWAGVAFSICFYLSRGLNGVILKDALNVRTPAKFRNTMNSLSSLCFRLGFAVFGPGLGWIVDRHGLPFTLRLLAFLFVVLAFALGIPLLRLIPAGVASTGARRPAH